jgi:hypothetical protein
LSEIRMANQNPDRGQVEMGNSKGSIQGHCNSEYELRRYKFLSSREHSFTSSWCEWGSHYVLRMKSSSLFMLLGCISISIATLISSLNHIREDPTSVRILL